MSLPEYMIKLEKKSKVILESDKDIVLPTKEKEGTKKEFYMPFAKDGHEITVYPGERTIIAHFEAPFEDEIIGEFEVKIQIMKKCVFMYFTQADVHSVWQWLQQALDVRLRLEGLHLTSKLLKYWNAWPWNLDMLGLVHGEELVSCLKALPAIITVTSIRRIPKEFYG